MGVLKLIDNSQYNTVNLKHSKATHNGCSRKHHLFHSSNKLILSSILFFFITLIAIPLVSSSTPISEIYGPTPYGIDIIAFVGDDKTYYPKWIGLDYSVSNDSGDIVYSETCDPYGNVTRSSGDKITSHGCFGRYFDEDLAASYVDGNWYDPSMGSQIDNGNFGPMEMIGAIYSVGRCVQGFCETAGEVAYAIGTMIAHPIDTTATMLQPGFEVYYSPDKWGTVKGYGSNIKDSVVAAWDRDHAYFLGACGFEGCALLIPGGNSRWLYKVGGGKGFRGGGAGASNIITDPRRMLPVSSDISRVTNLAKEIDHLDIKKTSKAKRFIKELEKESLRKPLTIPEMDAAYYVAALIYSPTGLLRAPIRASEIELRGLQKRGLIADIPHFHIRDKHIIIQEPVPYSIIDKYIRSYNPAHDAFVKFTHFFKKRLREDIEPPVLSDWHKMRQKIRPPR